MAPQPTLFGDLILLEKLGEGAQGDAWLARHRSGDSGPLVVKRMSSEILGSERVRQRFLHEAVIAGAVRHPNVVRILESGDINGRLYLAMAYVEGRPLSRVLEDLERIGEHCAIESAIDVACDTLLGLGALHDARDDNGNRMEIIHRDVAPKNLMFCPDGRTVVIDFGVGRSTAREWQTATGVLIGTPSFMAPEQAYGRHADRRADLFAVGGVLFELLTLQRLTKGSTLPELIISAMGDRYVTPSSIRRDIPPELDRVLRRALAVEPDDRFQTAAEFIAALRTISPQGDGPPAAMLVKQIEWHDVLDEHSRVQSMVDASVVPPTLPSNPRSSSRFTEPPRAAAAPVPLFMALAALAFTLVVCVVAWWTSKAQMPSVQVVLPPERPTAPQAAPHTSQPKAVERPVAGEAAGVVRDKPPRTPKTTNVSRPPRTETPPPLAAEKPPPPKMSPTRLAEDMSQRLVVLRGLSLDKEQEGQVRSIFIALGRWRAAGVNARPERLAELDQQLRAIEATISKGQ